MRASLAAVMVAAMLVLQFAAPAEARLAGAAQPADQGQGEGEGQGQTCPGNLKWLPCAGGDNPCRRTCRDSQETPHLCTNPPPNCTAGCGCPEGQVLDEAKQLCVSNPQDECSEQTCPDTFVWTSCEDCFTDCKYDSMTACFMGCRKTGCVCPPGTKLDDVLNKCIDKDANCSPEPTDDRVLPDPESCPGDLVWTESPADCTCSHRRRSQSNCQAVESEPGCACPPDKSWRLPGTDKCVSKFRVCRRRSRRNN